MTKQMEEMSQITQNKMDTNPPSSVKLPGETSISLEYRNAERLRPDRDNNFMKINYSAALVKYNWDMSKSGIFQIHLDLGGVRATQWADNASVLYGAGVKFTIPFSKNFKLNFLYDYTQFNIIDNDRRHPEYNSRKI